MKIRTSKKLWSNNEWAVTVYGLECLSTHYYIEKKRLLENIEGHNWVKHLSNKSWTNKQDFEPAFIKSLEIFYPDYVDVYKKASAE